METNFSFAIGKTDDGKWVAATASSPFFLFRGDSEEEVFSLATKAIAFYRESADMPKSVVVKGREKTLSTFYKSKVVQDDCVAA